MVLDARSVETQGTWGEERRVSGGRAHVAFIPTEAGGDASDANRLGLAGDDSAEEA